MPCTHFFLFGCELLRQIIRNIGASTLIFGGGTVSELCVLGGEHDKRWEKLRDRTNVKAVLQLGLRLVILQPPEN